MDLAIDDADKWPAVVLALMEDTTDVSRLLLRHGADPRGLLRWRFTQVDGIRTATQVWELLKAENRADALDVVGDDAERWSLLQMLILEAKTAVLQGARECVCDVACSGVVSHTLGVVCVRTQQAGEC